jgi:hypothetical protein
MTNQTFTVLRSVGIKSNRAIGRASSTSKPAMHVATPRELGYSQDKCKRLQAILEEM